MKIYNTLTRKKEEFKTIDENVVKMYVCGPTVYDLIHIGNARPMIVFDAFRRYLEFIGYKVIFVSNFTDIDDKIINKALAENTTQADVANRFIIECKKDMESMNIKKATFNPLATEEVDGMISLIEDLISKGYAYKVDDGTVYFDTLKFKEYGKLSHKNLDDLQSGFRNLKVTGENDKKNSTDFVLWKPKKEGEPYWESPFCDGRPGWHTECCVMAPKYCGGRLDIHAGGEDLIFPHHENEIAQYEAAHNETFSNYWMHNAFLNINGEKMSKSLGNFYTVRDVLNKYDGNVLRLLMLSTQYRVMLNFSFELMDSSKSALERIVNCSENILFLLKNKNNDISMDNEENIFENKNELYYYINDLMTDESLTKDELDNLSEIKKYVDLYFDKLDDDFNTADAITQVYEIVKLVNSKISEHSNILFLLASYNIINCLSNTLGIYLKRDNQNIDKEIEDMIEARNEARKNKDFAKADEIRQKLLDMGIELEDTRQGVKWKRI